MNPYWHDLIQRYMAGVATDEEAASLHELLRNDDAAARLYLAYANLDFALEAKAAATESTQELLIAQDTVSAASWLSWRPLAAAASGLIVGLVSAAMVLANYAPLAAKHLVAIANVGFENQQEPEVSSAPLGFGMWSGNGEAVSTYDDVTPTEGRRMFRFISNEAAALGTEPFRESVSQVVDMRSQHELLRDGRAALYCSASFNGIAAAESARTTYRVDVRAYLGDAAVLQKPFPERAAQEVAHSVWRTEADDDPSTWQQVSGSTILPPETEFVLIELKVFSPPHQASTPPAKAAHFADDVQVFLSTTTK